MNAWFMTGWEAALPSYPLFAEAAFPRGPGIYYNPIKLLVVLLVYLAWVRTCAWVDEDCKAVKPPHAPVWSPTMLGCGVAGLLLVWVVPVFWAGFIGLVVLYLAPTLIYVYQRNEEVSEDERVLTPQHLRELANHYLKLGLSGKRKERGPAPIPIRFISKSTSGREDDNIRVNRAAGSRGYQAALEMVHEGIQMRATDIHLEPTKEEMSVRFRIDGILQPTSPFSRAMGDAVVNIFKVLANLDITEKRKPQDGSFSAEVLGEAPVGAKGKARKGEKEGRAAPPPPPATRQVDFRVATAGSVAGEKLVMRILDRSRQVATLSQIGMRDKMRDQLRALSSQPHGLLIVVGPTGAGKSTSLYACLTEIDRFQKNVITVENPVEYHMDNATQIEINIKAGKTFASELRSILRQDPDVIYIGEVRDQETAEIACQAAQTGHMVFTTMHANDTVTALGRLLDLGVQPFMVASSVSAVLGQRLVRVLCPKCKVAYKPNPEMLRKANLPADKIKTFYRPPKLKPKSDDDEDDDVPKVCAHCGGSGYRGRTGIYELLVLNDRIRELIRESPDLDAIRQEGVKGGMVHLQQDGMRQVIEGVTSIEELLRVAK